jgi:hypothetical protein
MAHGVLVVVPHAGLTLLLLMAPTGWTWAPHCMQEHCGRTHRQVTGVTVTDDCVFGVTHGRILCVLYWIRKPWIGKL